MLLLVAIFVGVMVVFLRQNNKCVMDEDDDDVVEGFINTRPYKGYMVIRNHMFNPANLGTLTKYVSTGVYTYNPNIWRRSKDPTSFFQVRKLAMTECTSRPDCIGLEIDHTGKQRSQIKQVLNEGTSGLMNYDDSYNLYLTNDGRDLINYIHNQQNHLKHVFKKYITPTTKANKTNILMKVNH
jgi:hypothetical protein